MELDKKLEFDPERHCYTYDGRELQSVTRLLAKHGITADLSNVPEAILKEKADHGTFVHEEIENYLTKGELGISDEFQGFVKLVEPLADKWLCEVMVHTDYYAGRVDLIGLTDDKILVIDTKTGNIDKNAVSWQTSMYANAFPDSAHRFVEYYCFDAKMNGESKLIKLDGVPKACIDALIEADKRGEVYNPMLPVVDETQGALVELERTITDLESQLKTAKSKRDSFMTKLQKAMEDGRIMSFDSPALHITYVAPYDSVIVDSERLKIAYPDVYADCQKVSHRKASIRLKIKEV